MSFVYQLLASLFLALRSVLPIQIDNLPKPIREIVVTPTPTLTPTPTITPTPTLKPTPTPDPTYGWARAAVGWEPRYSPPTGCPKIVVDPNCRGFKAFYPVTIKHKSTGKIAFQGTSDANGFIDIRLPAGSYTWDPNEVNASSSSHREFDIAAGQKLQYTLLLVVIIDTGLPSPMPKGCPPGTHEKIIPPDFKVCEQD